MNLVSKQDSNIKLEAMEGIKRILSLKDISTECINLIKGLLDHKEADIQLFAAEQLVSFDRLTNDDKDKIVHTILGLITDKDSYAQSSALIILKSVACEKYSERLVGPLIKILKEDNHAYIKIMATEILMSVAHHETEVKESLLNLLNDKTPETRFQAASDLRVFVYSNPDLINKLIDIFIDENSYLRLSLISKVHRINNNYILIIEALIGICPKKT